MTATCVVVSFYPILSLALAPAFGAASWKPDLMPRQEEIVAALAAGPPTIADGAGVYVLTARGYELARASANGFHCLVGRDAPGTFEPQCFDAEGSATTLQAALLEAELRMGGKDDAEIEAAVAAAYAAGTLRAPRRPGINYMLSPANIVPIDDRGTVQPVGPHVMFYAPYLTDADLGGGGDSPVFVINPGTPGAYAIVMLGAPATSEPAP